jgi:hypothetical protein
MTDENSNTAKLSTQQSQATEGMKELRTHKVRKVRKNSENVNADVQPMTMDNIRAALQARVDKLERLFVCAKSCLDEYDELRAQYVSDLLTVEEFNEAVIERIARRDDFSKA